MKALILVSTLAAAVVGFSQIASADIPLPHNPNAQSEVSSVTYSGDRAKAKWDAISSSEIPGNTSGWTGAAELYKVERSGDGLQQTVCTKSVNMRTHVEPLYSCTSQQSRNGEPLPQFRPVIHMG